MSTSYGSDQAIHYHTHTLRYTRTWWIVGECEWNVTAPNWVVKRQDGNQWAMNVCVIMLLSCICVVLFLLLLLSSSPSLLSFVLVFISHMICFEIQSTIFAGRFVFFFFCRPFICPMSLLHCCCCCPQCVYLFACICVSVCMCQLGGASVWLLCSWCDVFVCFS